MKVRTHVQCVGVPEFVSDATEIEEATFIKVENDLHESLANGGIKSLSKMTMVINSRKVTINALHIVAIWLEKSE